MKRLIDYYLQAWRKEPRRKPLLLRGARQVGKTHAVRTLGKTFDDFVEVNFELQPNAAGIFEKDLDPFRILRDLSLLTGKSINPGKTLLFLDEVQGTPRAITALRYFYEEMPALHAVAAGSLLDFAIRQVGVPVGRVAFLHMHPVSFIEFLVAKGKLLAAREILAHNVDDLMPDVIHERMLDDLGEYLAIGGMPEVVCEWIETGDPLRCQAVHRHLINTYRQDFGKYATQHQIKYVDLLFDAIPRLLGKRVVFSHFSDAYRKRELAPALDLLQTAGIVHAVTHSSGNGVPLGAEVNPEKFKLVFLDVALAQAILGLDLKGWFLDRSQQLINRGPIAESYVGQEILAYTEATTKGDLYYWHREARGSHAEVDYLLAFGRRVHPTEVKSGLRGNLASMRLFRDSRDNSAQGIRLSAGNYSLYDDVASYPLYAVARLFAEQNHSAFEWLLTDPPMDSNTN